MKKTHKRRNEHHGRCPTLCRTIRFFKPIYRTTIYRSPLLSIRGPNGISPNYVF